MTDHSQPVAEPEWRCFHCDEVFTDRDSAAEHFGVEPEEQAMCRQVSADDKALLKIIADQAQQLNAYRNESTPADLLYHVFSTRIAQQAITSEEEGYRRGLEDGRRDWLKILWWRIELKLPWLFKSRNSSCQRPQLS